MRALLSANAIRTAVHDVLVDPSQDRVVAVAFVGKDPTRWLPSNLKGIQLYCWPKLGSTNPASIETLLNMDVEVHFVENLHAKLFWGAAGGAVIGSANLSENGMDENRLIEAAVHLPAGDPAIADFLSSIHARAVGSKEHEKEFRRQLDRLHIADVQYLQRNPHPRKAASGEKPAASRTFGDWSESKMPERWQLGWWEEKAEPPRDAAVEFSSRYPGQQYESWLPGVKGELIEGVATLSVKFSSDPRRVLVRPAPYWWYPEDCIVSHQKNAQQYPYNWLARIDIPVGRGVPFNPAEKRFQLALKATVDSLGDDILEVRGPVRGRFLTTLKRHYGQL
ncbi:phospholipase D family protein [Massilia sp. H6]|uniref:phospholipase D family protein n=1 Tax=Massilia sp. H6 TaxID=2970464 RepID=UPI00216720CC|nr:phospholipase D family protein [Massilia sp. H6]UVW30708.1 phospholipase D family protein [Massilia sp. H6]